MYRMCFNWNFIALRCAKFKSDTYKIISSQFSIWWHLLILLWMFAMKCLCTHAALDYSLDMKWKQTKMPYCIDIKNFNRCFANVYLRLVNKQNSISFPSGARALVYIARKKKFRRHRIYINMQLVYATLFYVRVNTSF